MTELDQVLQWYAAGVPVTTATVVATWRSAPRQPGATMVRGPDGEVVGSVSGGCVEAAVYAVCEEVAEGGTPRLERYGVSDDDAGAVGLTCGGILDVFVQRVDPASCPDLNSLAQARRAGAPVALATLIDSPDRSRIGRQIVLQTETHCGGFGSDRLDAALVDDARGLLALGQTAVLAYGPEGERRGSGTRIFVQSFVPRPRLIVFGAIDFAAAVAQVGDFLGYRVTVCDARPLFATTARFPAADEVVVNWPHRYLTAEQEGGRLDGRTVVVVLTHDPKFDVPALQVALRLPGLAYVGAMGSRRTHEDRLARLREAGLDAESLARLRSPIGLDIGARTPQETAISIAAEIIADRWGGGGRPLGGLSGPIHHESR